MPRPVGPVARAAWFARATAIAAAATVAVAAGPGPARADRMPVDRYVVPGDPDDFWREVVHPHADEVLELQRSLAVTLRSLDDQDGYGNRSELVQSGLRMARYARLLDPGDLDALYYAGAFADEAGRATEAERVLDGYLARAPAGPLRADALLRIGRIALRQHRTTEAINALRRALAQPAERPTAVKSHVALAHALEATGDVGAAIAVLRDLDDRTPIDGDPATVIGYLALAALYDRDEQITAAFDIVIRLKNALDSDYSRWAEDAVRLYPPPVAADLHYYRALAYETTQLNQAEARAEWFAFERAAGSTGAGARARDHRLALDRELARERRPAPAARRGHR